MKLNHIRDVLAVAELGSLRAAGRQVGVAQPSITKSIQEIEHELGAALFERHSRGVRLTRIGEAFVARARLVDSELRRAKEEVEQLKGRSTGQVTIALSIASSIALMPSALRLFYKRYPDALLKVSETLFQPIEQQVSDGGIDVYVGALELPISSTRLLVEKLFDNERVVVARKGHPLLEATSLEALRSARWVRPAQSSRSIEADFEGWLRSLGLPQPIIVMHTRSALLTMLAVASSDLLTVVPRQWLELPALADRIEALPLIGQMPAAPVCLVRQRGVPLTPMAEHFCDVVRRLSGAYQQRARAAPHDLRRIEEP
jgi:LysR family transcriptional regulator of abg operon